MRQRILQLSADYAEQEAINYAMSLNPELLPWEWYLSQMWYFEPDPTYQKTIHKSNWWLFVASNDWVNGKWIIIRWGELSYIWDNWFDLWWKSFVISLWAAITALDDVSTSDIYLLWSKAAWTTNNSLHIWYRQNNVFTIAFWSNDVNITLPSWYTYSDQKNKLVHYLIEHDVTALRSKLRINWNMIWEWTHSSSYSWVMDVVFWRTDTQTTKWKLSQFRVWISASSIGIADTIAQKIYNTEYSILKRIS